MPLPTDWVDDNPTGRALNAEFLNSLSAEINLMSATMEDVNTKIGSNTDPGGTTTIFARLAQIYNYLVNTIADRIGVTTDTGGSTTAGSVMAKLNAALTNWINLIGAVNATGGTNIAGGANAKLNTLLTHWTATRAGYLDNLASGVVVARNVTLFSTAGAHVWTKPANFPKWAEVLVVGGGGGGAGGFIDTKGLPYSYSGGSAGAPGQQTTVLVDFTAISSINMTIGTGGAGGPRNTAGTGGQMSTFGTLFSSLAGRGGDIVTKWSSAESGRTGYRGVLGWPKSSAGTAGAAGPGGSAAEGWGAGGGGGGEPSPAGGTSPGDGGAGGAGAHGCVVIFW